MDETQELHYEIGRLKAKINSQIDSIIRMSVIIDAKKPTGETIDPHFMSGYISMFLSQNEKEG